MPTKDKAIKARLQKEWYHRHKAEHNRKVRERKERIVEENKPKLLAYLAEHPCVGCGEADPIVLHFDHKDDVDKEEAVTRLFYTGYSWEKVLEEIAKCVVRCANCHARRTAKQFGFWKWCERQVSNLPASA